MSDNEINSAQESVPVTEQAPQTEEVKKEQGAPVQDNANAVEPEVEKPIVLSREVTLSDGTKHIVKKLKAGKYYEAQKYFVDWLSNVEAMLESQKIDVKNMVKEGTDKPDLEKIEKEMTRVESSAFSALVSNAVDASSKRMKLLAVSLDMEEKEMADTFYPEDITALLDAVMEVNNFMGNLKKSVAPTRK